MFSKVLFFIAAGLIFLFYACESPRGLQGRDLEKKLIGEWESRSLKLVMNSFKNKDTVKIFDVKEGEWETKMNIRPVKTIYFADGTYLSEHRNLKDSILFLPGGYWEITGDTILLRDTFPQVGLIYKYKLTIEGDVAEFRGLEDCDGDGKADDDYYGTLKKQAYRK